MKKILIVLMALVVTLTFGVYKAHEYRAQKAWEERVLEALASDNSLEKLMQTADTKSYSGALKIKLHQLSDSGLGSLVDSFIRHGYPNGPEEEAVKRAGKMLAKNQEYELAFYQFEYYRTGNDLTSYDQPMSNYFKTEQAVDKIIAEEIASRPSRSGKNEVVSWFYRSLDQRNPWQCSRAFQMVDELIKQKVFDQSEVLSLCKRFDQAVGNAEENEFEFLVRSKISKTLAEEGYPIEKRELGPISQASTDKLFSFAERWSGPEYSAEFVKTIIAELKGRPLSPEQTISLEQLALSSRTN